MGGNIIGDKGQDHVELVRHRQMQTYRFLRYLDQRDARLHEGLQKIMSEVSPEESQMLGLMRKYKPTVVVAIDLPTQPLRAHQGFHRMVKAEAIKKYREAAKLKAIASRFAPIAGKVEITHVWFCGLTPLEIACRKNKVTLPMAKRLTRPEDEQNAIQPLKAAIDGLVDAKLLRGDTRHDVKWGDFIKLSTAKEHFGKNGILLFIREINEQG